jgi:hypothetical protein
LPLLGEHVESGAVLLRRMRKCLAEPKCQAG